MGLLCLQGGNEFARECRDMDAYLLDAAGDGPVVVLPLAGAPGREYDTAGANGVRYYRDLGAADVTTAPDARTGTDAANAATKAVHTARLLVIPGGSPRRLRDAITSVPELEEAIRAAADDDDRVVTGSSAGAMVLCAWTVLPERGLTVDRGLGVVADFAVIPHYDRTRPDWERALREKGTDVLGIPECSGVLLDGEVVAPIGVRPATLITDEGYAVLATESP